MDFRSPDAQCLVHQIADSDQWFADSLCIELVRRKGRAIDNVGNGIHALDSPTGRDRPHLRILEGIRKQVGEGLGQGGITAFGLGADGVEVYEPRLEECPRHCLQRLVHPPVQSDLAVQSAENVGDGPLFWERWNWYGNRAK